MTYDFDGCADRFPPKLEFEPMDPNDLEAIVTSLEIAAIFLSPTPGSVFTREQLFSEARNVSCLEFSDAMMRILLPGVCGIMRRRDGTYCLGGD